jgi:CYTH domain-containing protein
MTGQSGAAPEESVREGKYARVERERRFLLAGPPSPGAVTEVRRITDRYLTGTRLRLRRVDNAADGTSVRKLTQKIPAALPGHVQGLITNTYLSPAEYDVLAALPAAVLTKTRLSVPPLGVDLFDPPLHGLVLAEAEFTTDEEALSFRPPREAVAEVTDDPRFSGGALIRTSRPELLTRLAEYGIDVGDAAGPVR